MTDDPTDVEALTEQAEAAGRASAEALDDRTGKLLAGRAGFGGGTDRRHWRR